MRPDYERFLRPGSPAQKANFDPNQPRDEIGQWTDAGASEVDEENEELRDFGDLEAEATQLFSAASRKREGHHYVPQAIVRNRGISDEAREVFGAAKTGGLGDPRSNLWDGAHRDYNAAVQETLDDYLVRNGIRPDRMTRAQAYDFLGRVLESKDPRIREFNIRIYMREIRRMLLRQGGRE